MDSDKSHQPSQPKLEPVSHDTLINSDSRLVIKNGQLTHITDKNGTERPLTDVLTEAVKT